MKILRTFLLVCGAIAGTALVAQESAQMATPPPPPPASSDAASAPAREPVQVDGLIHVQKLPTTAQLTNDAEAENMTITRMEQSEDRIIVTYRYASGNTRTFAYTTVLPEDPDSQTGAPRTMSAPPPPRAPEYTVIYSEPAPVYYPRYSTRYYDPWPTFSIGLGFGRSYGGYGYGGFGYHSSPRYYGGGYGGYRGGSHHGGRRH